MKLSNLSESDKQLVERAIQAAEHAYCPYSNFHVGAAVRASEIHTGANVENACYGLGICAERVALSKAIVAGDRAISAIAIACVDSDSSNGIESFMPCGACRQWIIEHAADARVLVVYGENVEVFTTSDILPYAFRLK